MRHIAIVALATVSGCAVSVPPGWFSCQDDSECPAGHECVDERCYPVGSGADAGRPDGGGDAGDGGNPDECSPPCGADQLCVNRVCVDVVCEEDAECDDGIDCTADTCADDLCVFTPDDTQCTAAADGVCDPDSGCVYCSPETCVAGPCEDAACDGDTCVRTPRCGASEMCCDGVCFAGDCEDLRPCEGQTAGTVCRASRGDCDSEETCDGTSPDCPADALTADGTTCRAASGPCDVAESCNGALPDCPADEFAPAGGSCGSGSCNGLGDCIEGCIAGSPCATANPCERGQMECTGATPRCVAIGNALVGTLCRASQGPCDVEERCTGSSTSCPADGFQPSTTECRESMGGCDLAETCSGSSATCPSDVRRPTSYVCRSSAGDCDVAETCTGGVSCPSDDVRPSGFECRDSAGDCDVAEVCNGSSALCPTNVRRPSGYVCRSSTTTCDAAETCTGSSSACPGDGFASSSVVCRSATNGCDLAENCTGTSATCPTDRFVASGSDPANTCGDYVCNGSGACFGSCTGCDTNCDSAAYCTSGSCRALLGAGATCTAACQCSSGTCSTYYRDDDRDTYGGAGVMACSLPSGYVTNRDDCDDGNSSIHPDAPELCNTTDEDCNGGIRNGCPSSSETLATDQSLAHCGPGTNGTSMQVSDPCPAGQVLIGFDLRTDSNYVQGYAAVCTGVSIVETAGTPEYSYRLQWSGAASTLPFRGSMTGVLTNARCPSNSFVVGYQSRISSSTYHSALGFTCGRVDFTRSGTTWVPQVTVTTTEGPFGSGSGTGCSRSCSGNRVMTSVIGRYTTAGGPTGVIQSIYPSCGTVGYVPQ